MAPSASSSTRNKRAEDKSKCGGAPMDLPCTGRKAASSSKSSRDMITGQKSMSGVDNLVISGCSTPKASRFRIPETSSCPPAPKKRRLSSTTSSYVSNRSPIPFFAPPDIELFFLLAFQNIPV
ncbi:hypothetical protein CJ030_MR0G007464 [Morella rubra]|uniref:Cyclin-dependent protein kinase inhibitor SMR13 n=1 Tax=Morella rubra TaxID=262757 RepID=A0A6A1UJH9_9ROSI|nr:hypothetical protein CJ030_MR0G007463 [Morella rubra]KAB1200382.1 hypothetical protein CJ030_MR0G007464 [Morella rubra]